MSYQTAIFANIFTPRACARGKLIGRGVVVVQKIATSRVLGIWATRKYNESIEFGKKMASVCFKSRDKIYKRDK
jgi:hypothetical protein